jgi:hypothetical protein
MFECPTCGYANHEGVIFCEACGAYFHTGGSLATDQIKEETASKLAPSGFPRPDLEATATRAVLVLTSPVDSRRFVVQPHSATTLLGRSDRKARLIVDVDVTGDDGQTYGISRRHARAHFLNGHYLLEDLESLNGTYLNGRKLRPYLPEVLHDGDEIKLGNLALKVSLEENA